METTVFEELVKKQMVLAHRISRIIENMKKKGAVSINQEVIRSRISLLEEYWRSFYANDETLRSKCDSVQLTADYFANLFDDTEEKYILAKAELSQYLDKTSASSRGERVPSSDAPPRQSLQRITIPPFCGDLLQWTSYKDLFQSLIIDDRSLSNVERLHYLKTTLSGEPADLISSIRVTEKDFQRAWEALLLEYDNPQVLVNAYLGTLMSLPAMTRSSASQLRTLLHQTLNAVEALRAMERPVDSWSDWLNYITVRRLDDETRRIWDMSKKDDKDLPSFTQLRAFLTTRLRSLTTSSMPTFKDSWASSTSAPQRDVRSPLQRSTQRTSQSSSRVHTITGEAGSSKRRCPLCEKNHFFLFCSRYNKMTPRERLQLVKQRNLCSNCLSNHAFRDCNSSKRCQICVGKHHTSLHVSSDSSSNKIELRTPDNVAAIKSNDLDASVSQSDVRNVHNMHSGRALLLATAVVGVKTVSGEKILVRALIDPCSEISLIQESLVQRLRLPRKHFSIPISGVATMSSKTKGRVVLTVSSRLHVQTEYTVDAFILNRLSSYSENVSSDSCIWPHLSGIDLADPDSNEKRPVELLLGADIYSLIIRPGLKSGKPGAPIAQATTLGWILTGPQNSTKADASTARRNVLHCSVEDDIAELLQRFWTIEEVSTPLKEPTVDEAACEQFFVETHTRDQTGRYCVRLPFRESISRLGNSRGTAASFLSKLERRFSTSSDFESRYRSFMTEYLQLNHMEEAASPSSDAVVYYLPHHGVFRESSTTTKLRVVFNGSSRTTTGVSLNDILHTGPNLLPDIPDMLLRWRCHSIVFSADMEKMYRQIGVFGPDRDVQRILWRNSPAEPIREYRLSTVTYGLACAPYLAMRTIRQLSVDEMSRFPLAASVLRRDLYMDDILSGSSSIAEAIEVQRQLLAVLKAGGFSLRKWTSNDAQLLANLPPELLASSESKGLAANSVFSLLGVRWLPTEDSLLFDVKRLATRTNITKRQILREMASVYDPLGLLAAVTVTAKILLQELWLLQVGWDDSLPPKYAKLWSDYTRSFSDIASVRVPRWFGTVDDQEVELHGFSDASEKAYAGVVYLKLRNPDSSIRVTFVAAKTRVAPLQQVSLPRLELCGAVLLSRLVKRIIDAIKFSNAAIHLWTDSTIVLHWLQGRPSKWKTFVANRVAEIQSLFPTKVWHHINSKSNPADLASRGILGSSLLNNSLWWSGPSMLSEATIDYQDYNIPYCQTNEEKRNEKIVLVSTSITYEQDDIVLRYSSLLRLARITAWCRRFYCYCRRLSKGSSLVLDVDEIRETTLALISREQSLHFAKEIDDLRRSRQPMHGSLSKLNPFLDERGMLRVGGRLKHSLLDYDEKHPIILAEKSPLTRLIIVDHHEKVLHGGAQLTLNSIRRTYWIPRGRRLVRYHLHRCVKCWRWRAKASEQIMSDLPCSRVTPARPFLNSGVDYAGPFTTKLYSGRCQRTSKSYVAVFVCTSTRAVHLELVSDYTSDAFIAAYRRFISRRGLCSSLRSDCGTTFVGADKELRRLLSASSPEMSAITRSLADVGTRWIFNPPAAPHFGGLWEAAVKSVKHHLRRVIGDALLTFEEFTTLLTQIEACLNSRPLTPLTNDASDCTALTPGHFLVGAPLTAIPEPSLSDVATPRLNRWQWLQQMRDHFWERWSNEYLRTLQSRNKWFKVSANVKPGDLCILLNEHTPPTRWPLGRVERVHSGTDGKVRVVTVRTSTSLLTRPIAKLCLFPSNAD